jgi:hypothetical protein
MDAMTDRGAIIHFAGAHHLSPALDAQGAPALSAAAGDGLRRCGWEEFFAAMRRRGLALAPSEDGSARFVPASRAGRRSGPGLRGALEHARRFWRALFPQRA